MPILLRPNQARRARLESAQRSTQYLAAYLPELQQKYPGCFVAVENGKLRGIGKTTDEALTNAITAGADASMTILHFVPRPGTMLFY